MLPIYRTLKQLPPFLLRWLRNSGRSWAPALTDNSLEVTDNFLFLHKAKVAEIRRPKSAEDLCAAVKTAAARGGTVSMVGLGHSSDGHQFRDGTILLDMRALNRVLHVDEAEGIATVESGVVWEDLVMHLRGKGSRWGIHVKQTLVNRCTIGGSLAINIHARKMGSPPFIRYIRAFTLVNAAGELLRCSREENADLFRLVIGGYGAFGVVYSVDLVLQPLTNLLRDPIPRIPVDDVCDYYMEKLQQGYLYGDAHSNGTGIVDNWAYVTMYKAAEDQTTPLPFKNTRTNRFLYSFGMWMLHSDQELTFLLWKDEMEKIPPQSTTDNCQFTTLGEYYEHIHDGVLELEGQDMHVEMQLDPQHYRPFMRQLRELLREDYGSCTFCDLRFVKQDEESFLRYAKRDFFTVSPTFHLDPHNEARIRPLYQKIYDLVVNEYDGCFYLWDYFLGKPEHYRKAYPQLGAFFDEKDRYDPANVFSSIWLEKMRQVARGGQ